MALINVQFAGWVDTAPDSLPAHMSDACSYTRDRLHIKGLRIYQGLSTCQRVPSHQGLLIGQRLLAARAQVHLLPVAAVLHRPRPEESSAAHDKGAAGSEACCQDKPTC